MLAEDGKQIVLDRPLAIRVLTFIDQLGKEGLVLANQDAAGGIATFQSGDAGLYWEGEWNVDIFQQGGLPFSMQPFPAVFGPGVSQADSHSFVIPVQPHHDPKTLSMVLTMVRTLLGQSLVWAGGGHIPAWLPVRELAAYQKLKPQSNYQSVANHVVYDPPAWYSGSGSDMENFAGGAIGSLMLGALTPAGAGTGCTRRSSSYRRSRYRYEHERNTPQDGPACQPPTARPPPRRRTDRVRVRRAVPRVLCAVPDPAARAGSDHEPVQHEPCASRPREVRRALELSRAVR